MTDPTRTPSAPEEVLDWLEETADEIARLEPADFYDRFIVGVGYRFAVGPVLAYDMAAILRAHVDEEGMEPDEAEEYFEYNTLGAWVGDGTPMFINTAPDQWWG